MNKQAKDAISNRRNVETIIDKIKFNIEGKKQIEYVLGLK